MNFIQFFENFITDRFYFYQDDHTLSKHLPSTYCDIVFLKKIADIALPILTLSPSISKIVTTAQTITKTFSKTCQTIQKAKNLDSYEKTLFFLFDLSLIAISFSLPTLSFKVNLLWKTIQNISEDSYLLYQSLDEKKYLKAQEEIAKILHHLSYLTYITLGGSELMILSLSLQIVCEMFQTVKGEKDLLEILAHLTTIGVRTYQIEKELTTLYKKKEFQEKVRQELEHLISIEDQKDPYLTSFSLEQCKKTEEIQKELHLEHFEELRKKYRGDSADAFVDSCCQLFQSIKGLPPDEIQEKLSLFLTDKKEISSTFTSYFDHDRFAMKAFLMKALPSSMEEKKEALGSFLSLKILPFSSLENDETMLLWKEKKLPHLDQHSANQIPYILLAYFASQEPEKIKLANEMILKMEPKRTTLSFKDFGSFIKTCAYFGAYDDFSTMIYTTILFRYETSLSENSKNHLLTTLIPSSPIFHNKTPNLPWLQETENHILMTNSSYYLKNKWLLDQKKEFDPSSKDLEEKLLEKLQEIRIKGLDEYHSIPYTGYTINALLNLFEFGSLPIQKASKAILDQIFEQFSYSSLTLRSFTPFRRQTRKRSLDSLQRNYELFSIAKFLSKEPLESNWNLQKWNDSSLAMIPAVSSYKLLPKTKERFLGKIDEEDLLVQISHQFTSIGGSVEIYNKGVTQSKSSYLLSAGSSYPQGLYSTIREIITNPTSLILNDQKSSLKDLFYIGTKESESNPGQASFSMNYTGVYKRFACGKSPVHVPLNQNPIATSMNQLWNIYEPVDGLFVAVFSQKDLGVMALFDSSDYSKEDLISFLTEKNSDTHQLQSTFFLPNGSSFVYDVDAPQDEWVMRKEKLADGKEILLEKDFTFWRPFSLVKSFYDSFS